MDHVVFFYLPGLSNPLSQSTNHIWPIVSKKPCFVWTIASFKLFAVPKNRIVQPIVSVHPIVSHCSTHYVRQTTLSDYWWPTSHLSNLLCPTNHILSNPLCPTNHIVRPMVSDKPFINVLCPTNNHMLSNPLCPTNHIARPIGFPSNYVRLIASNKQLCPTHCVLKLFKKTNAVRPIIVQPIVSVEPLFHTPLRPSNHIVIDPSCPQAARRGYFQAYLGIYLFQSLFSRLTSSDWKTFLASSTPGLIMILKYVIVLPVYLMHFVCICNAAIICKVSLLKKTFRWLKLIRE